MIIILKIGFILGVGALFLMFGSEIGKYLLSDFIKDESLIEKIDNIAVKISITLLLIFLVCMFICLVITIWNF